MVNSEKIERRKCNRKSIREDSRILNLKHPKNLSLHPDNLILHPNNCITPGKLTLKQKVEVKCLSQSKNMEDACSNFGVEGKGKQ